MGCGVFYTQLGNVNTAMRALRDLGMAFDSPIMRELNRMRGELLGRFSAGQALPRININLKTLSGLSEGLVRTWFDIETGFFTEGRKTPEDRPVYNPITPAEAFRLLQDDPDVDLAHELMERVPAIDN